MGIRHVRDKKRSGREKRVLKSELLEKRLLLAGEVCVYVDPIEETPQQMRLARVPLEQTDVYGPVHPVGWTGKSETWNRLVASRDDSSTSKVIADEEDWGGGLFVGNGTAGYESADIPKSFHFERSGFGRLDTSEAAKEKEAAAIVGDINLKDLGADQIQRYNSSNTAPNLRVTSIALRDGDGTRVNSIPVGQLVAIQVNFTTEGIPDGSSFDITFSMDGVDVAAEDITWATGTGSWFAWWSGWYASPGNHTFSARLDSGNSVFETDEADNFISSTFSPYVPTDLPQPLLFPSGGVRNRDFAIGNYADVDPRSEMRADFAGGIFQYDGHNAWDFSPPNFLSQDKGLPIVAAADGVVTDAVDGFFDRKTSFENTPANYVIIDHGNNWNTIYWHLARDSVAVEVGQSVKAGDVIGDMGSSGISTNTHLHYTLRRFNFPIEAMYDTATYYHPDADVAYQPTTEIGGIEGNISNDPSPASTDWRESFPTRRVFGTSDLSERVVLNFRLSHMNVGDSYQVRFVRPDSSLAWSRTYNASQQFRRPGWYWFVGSSIWGSQLGTWEAQVVVDGRTVISEEFEVVSGVAPGQIRVYDASLQNVNPGRTTPFDFTSGSSQTFRIENHGDASLTLGQPEFPMGFSVANFPTSVPPGSFRTFQVQHIGGLNSTALGAIRFTTSDPDLPEFWFNLEGSFSGSVPPSVDRFELNGSALAYQLGSAAKPIEDDVRFVPSITLATVQSLTFQWQGGRQAGDKLTIADRDGISVDGTTISYDGIDFGTIIHDGVAPNPLVVDFTSTGVPQDVLVEALVAAIDFESSSPVPGPRFLSAYTTDTGGLNSTQAYKSVRAHNAIYDLATIDGISFGESEAQRSRIEAIEIEFDDVVMVDPAAFTIVKLGSGGGTVEFELTMEEVLEKTVATLQLS
ncbi:MAG: M23 family metallopeptidase, partial [Planctomycetota bacterium]